MIKAIPLTKGMFCIVSDVDYAWAMQWGWFCTWSLKNKQPKGYAARSIRVNGKAKLLWLHKEILLRHIGPPPTPAHIIGDHENGDSLLNTRGNLRWATHQMNARNKYGIITRQYQLEV